MQLYMMKSLGRRNEGDFSFARSKLSSIVQKKSHLFALSIVLIGALSIIAQSDGARASDLHSPKFSREVIEMARDYRRLVRAMRGHFIDTQGKKRSVSELRMDAPQGKETSCYTVAHAIFYYRHKRIIDTYDTAPFSEEFYDVLRDRKDEAIPTDPRKVIVEIKYTRKILATDYTVAEEKIAKRIYATGGSNTGVCHQYLKAVGLLRSN